MTNQEKLELLHMAIHVYTQDKQAGNLTTGPPIARKTIPDIYKELLATIQVHD